MKRSFALLSLCALYAASCVSTSPHVGDLRHVVLFAFKDGTTPAQVAAIEAKFAGLPTRIPQIVDFEWGTDVSVERLAGGFTHCFLVTFTDTEGRAAYLPHAGHQELVALLRPSLEKVLVIDYVARAAQ